MVAKAQPATVGRASRERDGALKFIRMMQGELVASARKGFRTTGRGFLLMALDADFKPKSHLLYVPHDHPVADPTIRIMATAYDPQREMIVVIESVTTTEIFRLRVVGG